MNTRGVGAWWSRYSSLFGSSSRRSRGVVQCGGQPSDGGQLEHSDLAANELQVELPFVPDAAVVVAGDRSWPGVDDDTQSFRMRLRRRKDDCTGLVLTGAHSRMVVIQLTLRELARIRRRRPHSQCEVEDESAPRK